MTEHHLIGACAIPSHPAFAVEHPNPDQADRCTCVCHYTLTTRDGYRTPSRQDPFDPPLRRGRTPADDDAVRAVTAFVFRALTIGVVGLVLIVAAAVAYAIVT